LLDAGIEKALSQEEKLVKWVTREPTFFARGEGGEAEKRGRDPSAKGLGFGPKTDIKLKSLILGKGKR